MSFRIYLGNFTKRANSTAQPDYSGWDSTSAVWKKDKDLENPTIEFYITNVSAPKYNYMVIPEQDNYYWVTGITSVGANRWEISATVDLLATYRVAITNTPCYILYGKNADASGTELRIADSRQNVGMVPLSYSALSDITDGAVGLTSGGMYILSAVGANGGVTNYAMTRDQMQILFNTISRDIASAAPGGIEALLEFFAVQSLSQGSAISAIRSCTYIPCRPSLYSGSATNVYLGDFNTHARGIKIGIGSVHRVETDVAIPWPVNDWRRMNCQLQIYVPYEGMVSASIDQINNTTNLHTTWCLDLITGSTSTVIECDDYHVYTGAGNLGIPYAIGSSNIPIQNTINGALSTMGGAINVGGGALGAMLSLIPIYGGGAGGVTSGISQAMSGYQQAANGVMQAITPIVQGTGTMGGNAAIGQLGLMQLHLLYYQPVDNAGFRESYGWPVMRVTTPVAGYCQTRGFSMVSAARASEMAAIGTMMDNGVYIE